MKIGGYTLTPVAHALRHPLQTSHGRLQQRRGSRLELRAEGLCETAETLPLPSAGTEGESACAETLERVASRLVGPDWNPDDFDTFLTRECGDRPAARYALDVAFHRLRAAQCETTVASLLGATSDAPVRSHALLAGRSPAEAAREAAQAVALGFSTLKLKVASGDDDDARVAAVRERVGPSVALRLDANGGWPVAAALRNLEALGKYDIQCVEQPVAADEFAVLARLCERSPIPLAADESLAHEEGRRAFLAGGLTPIGVLKPMVQGGLGPAARMARLAATRGLATFVTTTFDGPCGTDAALQLAAAHSRSAVHGLATAAWMTTDFPPGLRPDRGVLGPAT